MKRLEEEHIDELFMIRLQRANQAANDLTRRYMKYQDALELILTNDEILSTAQMRAIAQDALKVPHETLLRD